MKFRIVTPRDSFYLQSAHCLATAAFERDDSLRHADSEQVQAYVIGAVVCSVAFLEVSINGLFEGETTFRKTKFLNDLRSVWSEGFDRQPTLAKYQIALALARTKPFDTGSEPYQSAYALIYLRNAIAHPKQIISDEGEQEKLKKLLGRRYEFHKADSVQHEFFPKSCLSPSCAAWALFAATQFFKEFQRRIPATSRGIVGYSLDAHLETAKRLLRDGLKKRAPRLFSSGDS